MVMKNETSFFVILRIHIYIYNVQRSRRDNINFAIEKKTKLYFAQLQSSM